MDFASTRKFSLHRRLSLATLVLVLSGCVTPVGPEADPIRCAPDCKVRITLPSFDRKPEIPREHLKLIVDGGSEITVEIDGGRKPEKSKTRLVAEEAIFGDAYGGFAKEIEVSEGSTTVKIANIKECQRKYRVEIDKEVMCKFKYNVINVGNSNRKPLDPWIIIRK